jgi:hypothetical protein
MQSISTIGLDIAKSVFQHFRTQPAAPAFENCWHATNPHLANTK